MKLEFRKNDKMFYVIVGLALLFIIAMYLYHSQKKTVENFDDNDNPLIADWRADWRRDAECKKNLDSFLKEYTDFKIVGSWALNGVPVQPFQIDNKTVVFIGKDGGYFKMIGFDYCKDTIQRIKGKAVWIDPNYPEMDAKLDSTRARILWNQSTPHDNIGPGYYDLDYNYIPKMVKVWREEGPPWFLSDESCKNIFDGYKKYGNKLSGSWIPGGVKSTLHGVVEHNGKEIVVFAGYHDGYYKMVGYDFCQFPPKRIDGRAKKTKKFRIPTEGDKRYISDFWNSAEYKGIKEGNYNLNLEVEGVCESGEKKYFDKDTGEWKCPFTPPTISLYLPCPEAQGGGPPIEINGELKCPERCHDSGKLQVFNEETRQFECP